MSFVDITAVLRNITCHILENLRNVNIWTADRDRIMCGAGSRATKRKGNNKLKARQNGGW